MKNKHNLQFEAHIVAFKPESEEMVCHEGIILHDLTKFKESINKLLEHLNSTDFDKLIEDEKNGKDNKE